MISIYFNYYFEIKENILKALKNKNLEDLHLKCVEMNNFLNVMMDKCLYDYGYFKNLIENV